MGTRNKSSGPLYRFLSGSDAWKSLAETEPAEQQSVVRVMQTTSDLGSPYTSVDSLVLF